MPAYSNPLQTIAQSMTNIQYASVAAELCWNQKERMEDSNLTSLVIKCTLSLGTLSLLLVDKEIIHGFTAINNQGQKVAIVDQQEPVQQ